MTKYNVVAINSDGAVIDAQEYDPRNDSGRPARRQAAADAIAERNSLAPVVLGNRGSNGADGTEWHVMQGEFAPGMVETGIGKWGFSK